MLGVELDVTLTIRNTGSTPFLCSSALHTYLAISDIHTASIEGLAQCDYVDYSDGSACKRWGDEPVRLTTESAYFFFNSSPVLLHDPKRARPVQVKLSGAAATVVWNPGESTGMKMSDVGKEWSKFICIESANIPETAVSLAPSCSHHLGTRISSRG